MAAMVSSARVIQRAAVSRAQRIDARGVDNALAWLGRSLGIYSGVWDSTMRRTDSAARQRRGVLCLCALCSRV